jgi:hypothetical protein
MQIIHKYKLDIVHGVQQVNVPSNYCEALSVDVIEGVLYVWIKLIIPSPPQEQESVIKLEVFGTGWPIELGPSRKFIGTAVDRGPNFVWHVFQRTL